MTPLPTIPSTVACAAAAFLVFPCIGKNIVSAWTDHHVHHAERTPYRRPTRGAARPLLSATVQGSDASDACSSATVPPVSPVMAAYGFAARGRELQERGALNSAVLAFTDAASHHPTPERHLRLGLALEENGEPLRAIESYNRARTASTDPVLRHDVALKLAHVWADDLGDLAGGTWHADAAMAEEGCADSAAAKDRKAVFLAAEGRIAEAIGLWDEAFEVWGRTGAADSGKGVDDARFFRAIAQALTGQQQEAEADLAALPADASYMVDSWRYIASHPPQQEGNGWHRLFSGTYTFLADALSAARPDGLVCEFGVFHGKSIRLIAAMVGPQTPVDGFDTFEGIPEAWGDEAVGSYTAALELPERCPDNVAFHVGLFADTLPPYVASLAPPEVLPVRLINVDCDLYQGTVEILHYLAPRIGPGTVIVFDEYLMHPTWPEDEYKAFQEACAKFGWEYEYLTFSLVSKQAVVRITASDSFVGPVVPGISTAVTGGGY